MAEQGAFRGMEAHSHQDLTMPSDVPSTPIPAQPDYPFEPDGVRLRPLLSADAEAINAYRSLPEEALFLPQPPQPPQPPQSIVDTEPTVSAMLAQQAFTRWVSGWI